MPLHKFKCVKCEKVFESLKKEPQHCGEVSKKRISAPATKFREIVDSFRGKKREKNLNKTLKERARSYSRDVEGHELIQKNKDNELVRSNQLNEKGEKRKKIDDI